MPKRIQRKRTRGWRMPKNSVYVGRPTKWGNPFQAGKAVPEGLSYSLWVNKVDYEIYVENRSIIPDSKTAVRLFREFIRSGHFEDYLADRWQHNGNNPHSWDIELWIKPLRNADLACWCPLNRACHADVLLELME